MIAVVRDERLAGAATFAALALLVLRRPGWGATGLVAAAGLVALAVPVRSGSAPAHVWVAFTAAGIAACAVVGLGSPGVRTTAVGLGASIIAALAEEVVFRRTLYGWLAAHGAAVAIGAGAVAFALVHVPAYGWGVVPIDLGAGIVFGWQRWATGTWTAPAATHVAANLIVSA